MELNKQRKQLCKEDKSYNNLVLNLAAQSIPILIRWWVESQLHLITANKTHQTEPLGNPDKEEIKVIEEMKDLLDLILNHLSYKDTAVNRVRVRLMLQIEIGLIHGLLTQDKERKKWWLKQNVRRGSSDTLENKENKENRNSSKCCRLGNCHQDSHNHHGNSQDNSKLKGKVSLQGNHNLHAN